MTIDNNCLETEINQCKDTQTRQKTACKDSGNFNTIKQCTSGADREFESCEIQANIDCETQDTEQDTETQDTEAQDTTTKLQEITPPPPTQNITNRTETSRPPPPLPLPPSSSPPSSPSLLPPSSPSPSLPSSSQGGRIQLNVGAIVGGVMGGLALLVLAGGIFYLYRRSKKNKDAAKLPAMERGDIDANSKNRAAEPSDTQFSVRSPEHRGIVEVAAEEPSDTQFSVRSPLPAGVVQGDGGWRFDQEKLLQSALAVQAEAKLHRRLLKEFTGGDLTAEQAANAVLSQLNDDSKQEGTMGAAGGTAVVHASEALGPDSPDDPRQQLRKDDDVIPDDVKECMEEIILTLEKDLKFEPQTMITPPPQPELSPSPDNMNDIAQEAGDSPSAARNFWGKIDQAAKDQTSTRLSFTPTKKSPTKPEAEQVSPGMRGGHRV